MLNISILGEFKYGQIEMRFSLKNRGKSIILNVRIDDGCTC